MLTIFKEAIQAVVQRRREAAAHRNAILLWNNGWLDNAPWKTIVDDALLDRWAQMLREGTIKITNEENASIGEIAHADFWQAIHEVLPSDHRDWNAWLYHALESGNTVFLSLYTKPLSNFDCTFALHHPDTVKWLMTDAKYSDIDWQVLWNDNWSAESFYNIIHVHTREAQSLENVRDILMGFHDLFGASVGERAVDAMCWHLNRYVQNKNIRNEHYLKYQPLLKEIWMLTQKAFPFEVRMCIEGIIPNDDSSTSIINESHQIMRYMHQHQLLVFHDASIQDNKLTKLSMFLDLYEPRTKEELLVQLHQYYNDTTAALNFEISMPSAEPILSAT